MANNHLAVKLPEFWPEDVNIWFTQCDAQFRISKITAEQTKFDYVIQKLDRETVKRIRDLIASPPENEPYTAMKERLLACFKKSQYEELQAFHDVSPLGDRRPTELMDDLLTSIPSISHSGEALPFIIFAFLHRLPEQLRSLVAAIEVKDDLRLLAEQSDRLWTAAGGPTVSHAYRSLPDDAEADDGGEPVVQAVRQGRGRRGGWRGGQNYQKNFSGRHAVHLCYSHYTFGKDADRCKGVCNHNNCNVECEKKTGNGQAGGRKN